MIDPTAGGVRGEERILLSLYIFPLIVFDGLICRDRRLTATYVLFIQAVWCVVEY